MGYLTHEVNANSNGKPNKFVYREITAQDAFGNIEGTKLNGDSLTGEYLYHGTSGQMLSSKVQFGAQVLHHLGYTDYDSYGNLRTQENYAPDFTHTSTDTFKYDALHRLIYSDYSVGGSLPKEIHYGYDAVGNITKKSDYSLNTANAYTYTTGTNQIASVDLKGGGTTTFGYDNKGNQTHRNGTQEVTYNVFNKPLTIQKNGSNITLAYGADLARYKQTRVENGKTGSPQTITTHYIDKHYEVEIDETGNKERKSYISDIAIFTDSDTTGIDISYTHRDRLGCLCGCS